MSAQDEEPFLSRWSRRKLERPKEEAPPTAAPAPQSGATPAPATPELPPVESLQGLASEYRDFLRPGVDEKLRSAALKRLFRDPHFNVMDGLDTYIDDYSKPDPIPEAMLRTLGHAKGLLFGDDDKASPALAENSGAGSASPAAGLEPARSDTKTPAPVSPSEPEGKT